MKQRKIGVTVCLLVLAISLAISVPLAYAGTTSSGSIVIGTVAPTVAAGSIWNSADTVNENNTVISVWVEYHINYSITDGNSLLNIANSTLQVWDSGGTTQGGADGNVTHYTFRYINSTDTWSEVGPGTGNLHIITGSCTQPSDKTQTSGTYKLAFKLDQTANYTLAAGAKSWKVAINVTDNSGNLATNTTIIFGVAFYYSINVVDTTHSWSTSVATLPATNATLDSPADHNIEFTVTANGNWKVQAEGSADPNDGAGHTITIGHILMHYNTLASATNMTTGFTDVGGLTGTDGFSQASSIQLWINVPSGTVSGTYTYTLTLQAVATA
jgi:hypothetical protein